MSARPTYQQAAKQLLRNTLLDAAREQIADRPFAAVTMAQVAKGAGISRQTLYNEFGSREAFALALVLRETDAFLAAVEGAVRAHADDPRDALRAALDVFLTAAEDDPVVRTIITGDGGDELHPLVTSHGQPVVERAVEHLAAVVVDVWPVVAAADARLLAECVVRLALSLAALPMGPATPTAAAVASVLEPHLQRLLDGAT